ADHVDDGAGFRPLRGFLHQLLEDPRMAAAPGVAQADGGDGVVHAAIIACRAARCPGAPAPRGPPCGTIALWEWLQPRAFAVAGCCRLPAGAAEAASFPLGWGQCHWIPACAGTTGVDPVGAAGTHPPAPRALHRPDPPPSLPHAPGHARTAA